jgi:hypothetical protein
LFVAVVVDELEIIGHGILLALCFVPCSYLTALMLLRVIPVI